MGYGYKQLSGADVELLKALLQVFGKAFNDTRTYQDAVPSDEYLASLLGSPLFIPLVVMQAGEVVGGLAAYVIEKFEQNRREIYIYDLAVAEPHRRKGVATELLRELQRIAKKRNAYLIFVQADKQDEAAVKLYETFATRQNVLQFDIPV